MSGSQNSIQNCSYAPNDDPLFGDYMNAISYMWNCSYAGFPATSCALVANNDVAGSGVLLAFNITAAMTLIAAWTHMIFDVDTALRLAQHSTFDNQFLRRIWGSKTQPKLSATWSYVIQRMILAFSDSHLVTGLAILLTAYAQMDNLTIYHFQLVVYLAWLSNTTHLVCLTVLRSYFRANGPVMRWRIICMTAMVSPWSCFPTGVALEAQRQLQIDPSLLLKFICLFAALVLTSSELTPSHRDSSNRTHVELYFDSPIVCSWKDRSLSVWNKDTVFSVCILTFGYLSRLAKLLPTVSDMAFNRLRERPGEWLKNLFSFADSRHRGNNTKIRRSLWISIKVIILIVYIHARAIYDLYQSLLSKLVWLSFVFLWGTTKVWTRQNSPTISYEASWSFGQLLPMVLLVFPFLSIPELYSDSRLERSSSTIKLSSVAAQESLLSHQPICAPGSGEAVVSVSLSDTHEQLSIATAPRPLLLTNVEEIYKYRSFHILTAAYATSISIPFVVLIVFQAMSYPDIVRRVLNNTSWFAEPLFLSCTLGPCGIWSLLCAPMSRILRKNVSHQRQPI